MIEDGTGDSVGVFLGDSPAMRALIDRSQLAARTSVNVLITGDTGTGKSLLARRIHRWSDRAAKRFVAISCAALPADLVESELFGHERGAFTGATAKREGRFELANEGTLFLDEIGEMPLALQPKLLRVLQSGEFEPIGARRTLVSNARIISATNKGLRDAIACGEFRQDLYFRLNVITLHMPRLCERPGDIERLAISFVHQCARAHGAVVSGIDPEALAALAEFEWPGNVRQLRNVIERGVVFARDSVLRREDLELTREAASSLAATDAPQEEGSTSGLVPSDLALDQVERLVITKTLAGCGGSRQAAAERLGLSLSTLYRRLRQYRESDNGTTRRPAA